MKKIFSIIFPVLISTTMYAQIPEVNISVPETEITTDCGFDIEMIDYSGIFNQAMVDDFRDENRIIYRFGRIINDFTLIIKVNLYHPDNPAYGVYESYEVLPGEKLILWDEKYSIGSDWGIEWHKIACRKNQSGNCTDPSIGLLCTHGAMIADRIGC